MKVRYKVNDEVVFTEQYETITEGTTGKVKRFRGCSCKPDSQGAVIEVDGVEYVVNNFRSKVSLVNG
jgi:hypothetical protein